MDLKTAKGFATTRDVLKVAIANNMPGETGFEDLSPNERFDNLWNRGMTLINSRETAKSISGGIINAFGRTETGTPLEATLTLQTKWAPRGSLGPDLRTIEARWSSYGEELGEPEAINDTMAAIATREQDEGSLRLIALLEESLTAVEELTAQSETPRLSIPFASNR